MSLLFLLNSSIRCLFGVHLLDTDAPKYGEDAYAPPPDSGYRQEQDEGDDNEGKLTM
jgi:hypothetical protein